MLATTTYGNGEVATLDYDAAKRPIGIDYVNAGVERWLDRGYDRAGHVVLDDRSLGGALGTPAGSGQLLHAYDGLGRLTSTTLAGTTIGAYVYDRSSNRRSKTEDSEDSGTTLESFVYTHDRTDALIDQKIDGGSTLTFAYDGAGNVTTERTLSGASRTLAWDAANRLTAITIPGTDPDVGLTYDPLDRLATRTVTGSSARTFAYVGASDLAWQVPSDTVDAKLLTGPDGSQPGVSRSGTAKWLLPDLLGSVALAQPASGAISTSDALRTDAWGTTIGIAPGSGSDLGIRFRGLVDLAPTADPDVTGSGSDALYAMGARVYSPHTGAFGSLDTYPGSATNPISMARYLYAHADPATLIDPTGHMALRAEGDSGYSTTPKPPSSNYVSSAGASAWSPSASKPNPAPTTSSTGHQQAGGSVAPPVRDSYAVTGWAAPEYQAQAFELAKQVGEDQSGGLDLHTALDVAGFVPVIGIAADLANAALYLSKGDLVMAGMTATAAIPIIGDAAAGLRLTAKYGDDVIGAVGHGLDDVGAAPFVRYGELDDLGRPTGVDARITPALIGTGSPATFTPPGFGGGAAGHARGHLLGRQLGGSGGDPRNIATMVQTPANSPAMRGVENSVRAAVEAGDVVDYSVRAIYDGPSLVPRGMTISAHGNSDLFVTILNRALGR